jgi:V8-like Glu-specific endopeptidase
MDTATRRLARLALCLSLVTLSACGGPATHTVLQLEKETVVTIAGGFECDPAGLEAVGAIVRPDQQTLCSGTLIADDTVLTAAHCVEDEDPAQLSFVIGAEPKKVAGFPIAHWSQHPRYAGARRGAYDIALLQLREPVAGVTPLPYRKAPLPVYFRGRLTFVGYGNNDGVAKTGAGIKRCVRMPISRVEDSTFQNQTRGRNSCHGDSGGPVLDYRNGKWEIVGVIASGDSQCERLGFSARVDVAAEWITQTASASHASTGPQ